MIVSVLSAGPSVARTWKPNGTVTIGVNDVVRMFHVEHFVAGDKSTIERSLEYITNCRIWTSHSVVPKILKSHNLKASAFDSLAACTLLPRPWSWSIQGALAVATHIGGEHIDIYGCDMIDGPDVAGLPGKNRTEDRWRRERRDLNDSVNLISSMGITITFHH